MKRDEIKINGWECEYFATKVMDLGTKYAKEGSEAYFYLAGYDFILMELLYKQGLF